MRPKAPYILCLVFLLFSACQSGPKQQKRSIIIDPEIRFLEDSYTAVYSYLQALQAQTVELKLISGSGRQSLELLIEESQVLEEASEADEKWATEKLARTVIFSLENPYVFAGIDINVRGTEIRDYWYDQLEMTAP